MSRAEAKRAMQLYHSGRAGSLKAAWRMVKGGNSSPRRKGHHSPARRAHHSSPRPAAAPVSRGEKIGATYLNAKMGIQILSPVTDSGIRLITGDLKPDGLVGTLRGRANVDYGEAVVSSVGQRWLDKKLKVANALSRYSVTAWAAELYPGVSMMNDYRSSRDVRVLHRSYVASTTGYDSMDGSFSINRALPYLGVKYGGAIARKVLTKTGLSRQIGKALGTVGVTA